MRQSNPPKDLLRSKYDFPVIIEKFGKKEITDEVVYFGLPGPLMLDVKEWNEHLDYIIAVENKSQLIGQIDLTANSLGLRGKTQILQGDIESVLINWEDERGEIPSREFFHIVNLDFEGGFIGFSDIAINDKRTDAIRELFRHQKRKRRDFIFFLTVGFRERCGQEYDQKFHHIREELEGLGIDAQKTISWYLSHQTCHKLKVYIPYLIDEIGRTHRYLLMKYKCFYYRGTGNVPMMHFYFDFKYTPLIVSPQRLGLKSLLDAPLFIAYEDRVEPNPNHPPPII